MKSIEVQLLESLASGIHPIEVPGSEIPIGETDFDAMLAGAMIGKPETQLGIRFAPSVSGQYIQSEQSTIARAVDLAAAAGVDHALILHNERTLRVDVRNRIVLEAYRDTDPRVIDNIDGFVSLKTSDSDSETAAPDDPSASLVKPARVVRNASLVHALAGRALD